MLATAAAVAALVAGPYFALGVQAAPGYFGGPGNCPQGITVTLGTPTGDGVVATGGACAYTVSLSAVQQLSPAEQVCVGIHESGHAMFALDHDTGPTPADPQGIMQPLLTAQPYCKILAADYAASTVDPATTKALRDSATRAADHRCKSNPRRCRKRSPRLAARVLG